jgi:flagellar hook-basal body complex protein FliE
MNVTPIAQIGSIEPLQDSAKTSSVSSTSAFSDIYNALIDNVNTTNTAFDGDIVKASEGELDNPHQLLIDSTKARIALQLAANVRNDALSAYQEIAKMSV